MRLLYFCGLGLVCVAIFALSDSSRAQSGPWPGFQACHDQKSAAVSGDAGFNVLQTPTMINYLTDTSLRNPLLDDWNVCALHPSACLAYPVQTRALCVAMTERCFGYLADGSSCANDFSNPECGARRILNTMVLMKRVPYQGTLSWFDHVTCESGDVSFTPTCAKNGYTDEYLDIFLYSSPIFSMPLLRRASIMAHEAGHADGMLGAMHCNTIFASDCECPGSEDSCDLQWNGSGVSTNRRAVEFLEIALWQASEGQIILPPFVHYDGFQAANQVLDGRFERHPGFNLVPSPGSDFVYGSRKHWTLVSGSQVETSISGREWVDGATAVIQGIALTTRTHTTDDLRVCATMRKYEAEVAVYGSDTNAREISGVTVIPGQTDPEVFGSPGCARRVLFDTPGRTMVKVMPPLQIFPRQMGIVAVRALTNSAGDMLEMQADYREIDRGAAVGPVTTVSSKPGLPVAADWQVSATAPIRGGFLTGIGFGAQNGVLNALATNWSLGPDLETRAGGSGGSTTNTIGACPVNTVPIGVAAKAAPSPYGTPTVGYFSLVCAPDVWLSGTNANQRTFVRTSFMDTTVTPNVYYADGVFSGTVGATPHPPGTTTVTCPVPETLEGMIVRHGAEVDRIVSIQCSVSNPLFSNPQTTISVGVGGSGGQLLAQNCRTTPGPWIPDGALDRRKTMAPFFWYRSGWRLDGLALGCYPNLYDIETFEVNDGVFGWNLSLIDMGNGMDVGIRERAPDSLPDLKSRWIDVSKRFPDPDPLVPAGPPPILAGQGYGNGAIANGERWPPIEWRQQTENSFGGAEPTSQIWHERWFSAIARSIPGLVQTGSIRIFERAGVDLRHLPSSTGVATFEFRYFMEGPNRGGLRLQARPRTSTTWQTLWIFQNGITAASGRAEVDLLAHGLGGAVVDLRIIATTGVTPAGNIVVDGFRLRTRW